MDRSKIDQIHWQQVYDCTGSEPYLDGDKATIPVTDVADITKKMGKLGEKMDKLIRKNQGMPMTAFALTDV